MSEGESPRTEEITRLSTLANYADLFERMLDTVVLINPESMTILDANDSAERLLGIPKDSILGSSIFTWVIKEQGPEFEKSMRIAKRRYYPREYETQWQCPDGRNIYVRVVACMMKLSDGNEAIQAILRDITQERETQERIRGYIAELEILNKKLEALSTTDELTKLFNFRHFKGHIQAEHARAARYNSEYSVIFFDADNFKHYNDRNGHPAGDGLLRQISNIIATNCRDTDLAARYGGEEFVILCPETSAKEAFSLAERIRYVIAERKFPFSEYQPLGRVSLSIGIAGYPKDAETPEGVLEAADKALYYSKQSGRNKVTAYDSIKT
ncbi:MAG: sensor domain-containing diguanylate cyclase [Bdellovibrionota bacterium]